jgi:heterodisulfide reductase subunit A-like polyferredoxin
MKTRSIPFQKQGPRNWGRVGGIKTALTSPKPTGTWFIDRAPSIGGLMTLQDRTFPTNNCDCAHLTYLAGKRPELHIDLRTDATDESGG